MDIETEVLDELYCSSDPTYEVDGWRYVAQWRDSDSRWESHHYIVITADGEEFWEGHIARGLTEYQEGRDSEEMTKLRRVYPHNVTTVEYKTTP